MKRILVPTDFSDCADAATEVALTIAQKNDSSITFQHVMSLPIDWKVLPKDLEDQYPELQAKIGHAKDKLLSLVERAQKIGVVADQELSFSESYGSISKSLPDEALDIIVLGSHGMSGFRQFVMGSNAQKIMRQSQTPVLVVHEAEENIKFETVVYASDFESDTHDAFKKMLRFFRSMGGKELHLLNVTTPYHFQTTKESRDKMQSFLMHHEVPEVQIHTYCHKTIEAGIIEFARTIDTDMVAIANHGRRDISSLFIESIPENLIKFSRLKVMSIRV